MESQELVLAPSLGGVKHTAALHTCAKLGGLLTFCCLVAHSPSCVGTQLVCCSTDSGVALAITACGNSLDRHPTGRWP